MSAPMDENPKPDGSPQDRRSFLALASTAVMGGGLTGGYGMLAYMSGRFLYSGSGQKLAWLFVTEAAKVKPGEVVKYETPAGQTVTITRRGSTGTDEDFVALSSTCPHLGCRVHWQPQNNQFFCPCHNGAFDPSGKATAGPPAEARQTLPHYPIKVENGLIFIEVPLEALS